MEKSIEAGKTKIFFVVGTAIANRSNTNPYILVMKIIIPMSDVVRFGVSLDGQLLEGFDKILEEKGYNVSSNSISPPWILRF